MNVKFTQIALGLTLNFLVFQPEAEAQLARKQPMMEHFTQASCGPCATQNPIFEPIREAHLGLANHVAYHTSWPGVDPMYSANPTESNAMVARYGITGVPSMVLDGALFGGPAGLTEQTLTNAILPGSPIRLRVEETAGTDRDVTIYVDGIGAPPSGTHILQVLIVEDPKNYATPPGSNGERDFPNVFRQTLGGTSGASMTLPDAGSTNTYTFNYSVSGTWTADNVYIIAYVQNVSTRNILNSGSSRAPKYDLSPGSGSAFQPGGVTRSFYSNLEEFGTGSESLTISLTANQPGAADWSANFEYDGNTYANTATISLNGGEKKEIKVNVNSGSTSGIGEYTLEVVSNDDPDFAAQRLAFYVVNNVTDLVVNSGEGYGNGVDPSTYADHELLYTGGLEIASRDTRASANHYTFIRGQEAGAFDGVKNVYYNAGWTFPAASNDKIAAFSEFLDRGGNLFISAQDFGWEIMDAGSPFGTPQNRNFFLNYLEADYNGDGSTSTTSLTFDAADAWLGTGGTTNITAEYGAANVYPDEIGANGPEATTIMYYNGTASKTGGVRTEKDGYKVIYLGTGIEMFTNDEVAQLVVKLAHDYFWDGLSGLEFDALLASALLGQNMPNPTSGFTAIPLYDWNSMGTLRISDLQGRSVLELPVQPGQVRVDADLANLPNGLYLYSLSDGTRQTTARKLTILR